MGKRRVVSVACYWSFQQGMDEGRRPIYSDKERDLPKKRKRSVRLFIEKKKT